MPPLPIKRYPRNLPRGIEGNSKEVIGAPILSFAGAQRKGLLANRGSLGTKEEKKPKGTLKCVLRGVEGRA